MQGVVFNGHYLTYVDVAITEYLRAIGMPSPIWSLGPGAELYTVKTTIEYHAPAIFDDLLDVRVRVDQIGRTSVRFRVEIHRAEPAPRQHLTSVEVIYVTADPETRKSVPVPPMLRERIAGYEGMRSE